jgi:hypothetical protein
MVMPLAILGPAVPEVGSISLQDEVARLGKDSRRRRGRTPGVAIISWLSQ